MWRALCYEGQLETVNRATATVTRFTTTRRPGHTSTIRSSGSLSDSRSRDRRELRMRVRWTFMLGLGAYVAFIAGSRLRTPRPGADNIVLIISDDHRWDSLGVAGNRAAQTPALDGLTRTGSGSGRPRSTSLSVRPAKHFADRPDSVSASVVWKSISASRREEPRRLPRSADPFPGCSPGPGYRTLLVGKPWAA